MNNFKKRNHGWRIAGALLTLMVAMTMLSGISSVAFADESDGATGTLSPLAGGYGSNGKFLAPIGLPAADAIPISSASDLAKIGNDPSYLLSGSYKLTTSIDLSASGWIPIGNSSTPFTGTFDGQGYVISNLTITGPSLWVGLFGSASGATIENVGMEGTNISFTGQASDAGVLCGLSSGGTISNCYNTGNLSLTTVDYSNAGGICGAAMSGFISDCYNTGGVTSTSSSPSVGGICGIGGSGTINDCYNTGNISSLSGASGANLWAGGISGSSTSGSISNCYNTGTISSSGFNPLVGGICGDNGGTVNCCYNTGGVSSSATWTNSAPAAYAGGICGSNDDSASVSNCYNTGSVAFTTNNHAFAGGVCGMSGGAISTCYNVGKLILPSSGAWAVGAICGTFSSSGSAANCYTLNSYNSVSGSDGKVLTAAQMQAAANYVGFDFTNIWAISSSVNNGFPYLQGMTVADWTYVPAPTDPVVAFVTRFYELCLNRAPDQAGLNNWVNQLKSKAKTGANVANGFVFSPEFINKKVSNADYVTIMYKAFFNRTPDTAGYNTWLNALNMGLSRYYVLSGFVNSAEFKTLCASYGINPGTLALTNPADKYPNIARFVGRFYQTCLGRTADWAGLNSWVNGLQTKQKTGAAVANGFVFSKEFINRNVSNANYVTIMYQAFFNRAPDAGGYNNWLGQLNAGTSRLAVLAGFVNSAEFKTLCANYGINPGTLALPPAPDIAVQTYMTVTGTGSGWHGKLVIQDGNAAISFGIQHDNHSALGFSGQDALMFESVSNSPSYHHYQAFKAVGPGWHTIRLEWYKAQGIAKGYCDGVYVGQVATQNIGNNISIDWEAIPRANGDTVDASFMNTIVDSNTYAWGGINNNWQAFHGNFQWQKIGSFINTPNSHAYYDNNTGYRLWGTASLPAGGDWDSYPTVGARMLMTWYKK